MKRIVLWGLILGMLLADLGVHQPAWGQQITAAITGNVMDAANAVLGGATVTISDVDRGTVYVTKNKR